MSKRYAILGDLIAEKHGSDILAGGSGAIALAIRQIGGDVTLRSRIGSDSLADEVLTQIRSARIHPGLIDRVDGNTCSRTLYDDGTSSDWHQGVLMTKAGVIDIYALFAHNALVIDLLDQSLRHFIIDLPAHTDGMVRMLTTLNHLDYLDPHPEELEIAMRCDTIVGTEAQFARLTDESPASNALGVIFEQMPLAHLRAAIAITSNGLDIVSREGRILKPVEHAIPSLLMPQVVAGVAWGMANHAEWDRIADICVNPSTEEN